MRICDVGDRGGSPALVSSPCFPPHKLFPTVEPLSHPDPPFSFRAGRSFGGRGWFWGGLVPGRVFPQAHFSPASDNDRGRIKRGWYISTGADWKRTFGGIFRVPKKNAWHRLVRTMQMLLPLRRIWSSLVLRRPSIVISLRRGELAVIYITRKFTFLLTKPG